MGRTNKKPGKNPDTISHKSEDIRTLFKGSSMLCQDKFNNVSVAIFICDLKGSIIEVNKAAITLTDYTYTRRDLIRMNVRKAESVTSLISFNDQRIGVQSTVRDATQYRRAGRCGNSVCEQTKHSYEKNN